MAVLLFSYRKVTEGTFYILEILQKGTEGLSFFIYQKAQKGAERTFVPVVVLLAGCPVAALVIWWAAHGQRKSALYHARRFLCLVWLVQWFTRCRSSSASIMGISCRAFFSGVI